MNQGYKFVEFGIPLLISAWFFREMWPLVQATPPTEPEREPVSRADYRVAGLIAAAFFFLGLWRLGVPDTQYFDEVHHVRTGMEYVQGLDPHEWTHPPLSKLFMAGGIKLFHSEFDPRDGAWKTSNHYPPLKAMGWRFPSLCFGALSLLAMFALTRSLFGSRVIATAATLMLAADGVFFVHSRLAMTNIYTVCFLLTATLGTWQYVRTGRRSWLWVTGLALGLALATRWSSLWAWGFNGLVLLWHLWNNERPSWKAAKRSEAAELVKWAAAVGGAMIVLPMILYCLSYVPFVLQGPGGWQQRLFSSGEPGAAPWLQAWRPEVRAWGHGWFKVLNQQADMWRYHAGIKETHPYSSPWYSWPLMLRPVWYFYEGANGKVSGVWAIGNAFLWWTFLPVFATTAYLAVKERRAPVGLVTLFGLGMWLAWGIKPRPLIFMHYLFESIPFLCMALAYLGWRLYQYGGEGAKRFVEFWGSLVAGWFVFYYPLLSALPVPDLFFRMHLWLDRTWI